LNLTRQNERMHRDNKRSDTLGAPRFGSVGSKLLPHPRLAASPTLLLSQLDDPAGGADTK
jgi:hypothetical protein